MVTVALPGLRAPGRMRTAARWIATAAAKAVSPHRASLARLADMPLMVIGTGCIDFGAFHYVHMIGWVVTGFSLILVEHMISDPDEPGRT